MKRLILDFLRELPLHHKGIEAIVLFGSFLNSEFYRDVDVILVFADPADVKVSRSIVRVFKDRFSIDLHIQLFLSYDTENLENFLSRAGSWECIHGQGLTSKYPYVLSQPHG